MTPGKPNSRFVLQLELENDLQFGEGRLCAELRREVAAGTTLALRQHDGSLLYVSTAEAFDTLMSRITAVH